MNFVRTLPGILPRFQFVWNRLVGAYDCHDPRGVTVETSLTACSCALSLFAGPPCEHSLELLAQAEDGALTDGPASVTFEVDRQRAAQEAMTEEVIRRAWDYAMQDCEPGAPDSCFFCGALTVAPLVDGWRTVCARCLTSGCDDD